MQWDRKCAVSSYALPGLETFKPCKVFILGGICVTGGLHLVLECLLLVLELLLDLVSLVEVAAFVETGFLYFSDLVQTWLLGETGQLSFPVLAIREGVATLLLYIPRLDLLRPQP